MFFLMVILGLAIIMTSFQKYLLADVVLGWVVGAQLYGTLAEFNTGCVV
jgi:hypothetical protein